MTDLINDNSLPTNLTMTNLDKSELAKIGVQSGHLVRWRNPRMKPYIYGQRITKDGYKMNVLDLEKIINSCQQVGSYIQSLIDQRKTILFLITRKSTRDIVKEAAVRCGMPYIVNKWKGGFLTNFFEIKKKLKELHALNSFLTKDSFKNLLKKEQVSIEKRRNKLQNIYEGVINLYRQPDALFMIGLNKEKTAFREAKKIGIPVIAVCNTNCNPRWVDYVIPGNDESVKSITFFTNLVADAIIKAKEKNNWKNNTNTNDKENRKDISEKKI